MLDWMLQISIPEPFQSSPSFVAVIEKGFESDNEENSTNIKQQHKLQGLSVSSPLRSASTERDRNGNSNSGIARIKVVVCVAFLNALLVEKSMHISFWLVNFFVIPCCLSQ